MSFFQSDASLENHWHNKAIEQTLLALAPHNVERSRLMAAEALLGAAGIVAPILSHSIKRKSEANSKVIFGELVYSSMRVHASETKLSLTYTRGRLPTPFHPS